MSYPNQFIKTSFFEYSLKLSLYEAFSKKKSLKPTIVTTFLINYKNLEYWRERI